MTRVWDERGIVKSVGGLGFNSTELGAVTLSTQDLNRVWIRLNHWYRVDSALGGER